tara:strand:- start:2766 stop:3107 length:342 start_codon:yes stop_codon:yes gene_type:complete
MVNTNTNYNPEKYTYNLSGKVDVELAIHSTHKLTTEELDLIFTDGNMEARLITHKLVRSDFPTDSNVPLYVDVNLELYTSDDWTVEDYGDTTNVLGDSKYRDTCPTCGHEAGN